MAAELLICIVDDDPSMRSAVAALIRSAGYVAQEFSSAEDFLENAIVENLSCIITDIQMPGMSGIGLKQHLTAHRWEVPVIMITARHDADLEDRAIASGAVCFFKKPFKAEALIECLEKNLKPEAP